PLPAKISRLLREAVALVLGGVALYLALIFISFDLTDPGWSRSAVGAQVGNAGGAAGAWLSDLLFYLFCVSAWWLVAFFMAAVWWSYRRIDIANVLDPRTLAVAFTGFLTLLVASSGIESLRFHTLQASLPLAPGGILGEVLSRYASMLLGFTGATLGLVILFAIGLSLFSGLSWVKLSERIGAVIELAGTSILDRWDRWRDRRMNAAPAEKPDILLEAVKDQPLSQPMLRIELPETEIQKSSRSVKEKTRSLFFDAADSPLPPLSLLDEPEKQVILLSSDMLEFNSRLIERKLKEFGVEVKVVAAYPGPVITRYEIEPAVGVKGSQIVNLVRDLARAFTVASIRVVETIPGKST